MIEFTVEKRLNLFLLLAHMYSVATFAEPSCVHYLREHALESGIPNWGRREVGRERRLWRETVFRCSPRSVPHSLCKSGVQFSTTTKRR